MPPSYSLEAIGYLFSVKHIYPSYLKLLLCWLRRLAPVTWWTMLPGTRRLAAAMQLQVFRV
ncbi:hypothetical protein BSQ35_09415 [Serratia liquefaciens]|nr:hypothetical protein BSQ35_09415 [Serratia liquefaciens]